MEMWLKIAISRQNSYIQPEVQIVSGFRAQKLLEGQPILKGANIHLNTSQSHLWVYWLILYLSFSWIMRSVILEWRFCPLANLSENNQSSYYSTDAAKSLQSCPTLCNPIDGSPPGSAVPRINPLDWSKTPFFVLLPIFLPPSICLSLNKRWSFYKGKES